VRAHSRNIRPATVSSCAGSYTVRRYSRSSYLIRQSAHECVRQLLTQAEVGGDALRVEVVIVDAGGDDGDPP